jgi:glycosyltransferase involved in cell wall biosynthesis
MDKEVNPLITIITPSFNQGRFIEQTIQSVLNQTYTNIQYILVDGGSTDNTMEIVNKYQGLIDQIIHEKDQGQSDALNKGFRLAKGELVGWLNSDDILYPECVRKIVDLYQSNPDGAVYYCSKSDFIDENNELLRINQLRIPDRDFLLNQNYSVVQQGSFYSTGLVKKCNYLNPELYYCMDLDLWLRLLENGPIYSYDTTPQAAFRLWSETKTLNGHTRFLREIRSTLLKHNARRTSSNIVRTYWYEFKDRVKTLVSFFI